MKTIKKTTLIAAITAMAAFAVPAMASAAVWGPINTNKTLTSTTSAKYVAVGAGNGYSFECSNSTLGVHVRAPASSTLDITSASFTGCTVTDQFGCTVAVTATGLPWAVTTSGTNVSFTEHLQVTYGGPICSQLTGVTVDGPATGSYTNSTHTLIATPASAAYPGGMRFFVSGTPAWPVGSNSTSWKDATNTLTLT